MTPGSVDPHASDAAPAGSSAVADSLRTCRLRFTIAGDTGYRFDATTAGQVLRGAFGSRFRLLSCPTPQADCALCALRPACPYALVFSPAPPPGAERLRKNADIPRPFVLKPPLAEPGATLTFDMVLVGTAIRFLPYFVVTWQDLAARGLGPGRVRGRLLAVHAVAESGLAGGLVFDGRQTLLTAAAPRELRLGPPADAAIRLGVRFLTPTHLVFDGVAVRVPEFHHLVRRARDRVNALATFHGAGPLDLDYVGLGERAAAVRLVHYDLRWAERARRSSRTGDVQLLVGAVGRCLYEGPVAEFVPLLRMVEEVHVGKGAVFGQGWVQLEQTPADAAR